MKTSHQAEYIYLSPLYEVATCVFAVVVFTFFAFVNPGHVAFQEQYQMFLFTGSYAAEVIFVPGGLADYLARFLTQFFLYPVIGAAIIAILLVGVQYACRRCLFMRKGASAMLAYLPSVCLCCFLCNENALLSAVVSILMSVGAAAFVLSLTGYRSRCLTAIVLTPLLYFAAGPLSVAYLGIIIVHLLVSEAPLTITLSTTAAMMALAAVSVAVSKHVFPNPPIQMYTGIHYMRVPWMMAKWAWIAAATAFVVVALSKLLVKACTRPVTLTTGILVMCLSGWLLRSSFNASREEAILYERMAYEQRWEDIIARAEKKTPKTQLAVVALNLALSRTSQLDERMFEFYQNGLRGLVPLESIDFNLQLSAAEIYYHMAVPAMAHYLNFDAQQAIPDGQKSARCTMRLAETDIILGKNETARKHLKALEKTLFYSSKAKKLLKFIDDAQVGFNVEHHPEYGELRRMANTASGYTMPRDKYKELIHLLTANPDNPMLREYVLALALLYNDTRTFLHFYDIYGTDNMPRSYQEFIAMKWMESHDSWDGAPRGLTPDTRARMEQFARDHSARMPRQYMNETYGDTYWNYITE